MSEPGTRTDPDAELPEPSRWAGLRHPPRLIVLGARVAMVAAVVAVVVKVGIDNASSLRHIHLRVEPAWFAPAAAASLLAGLCMPLGWRLLISAYGPVVARRATLRIWWTAQITRYVPTGAAALATRVVLAAREGVPRVLAGASLPIEVAIVVGWGTVLTGALLPDSVLVGPARVAVAALGAVGLVGMPVLLRLAGRWVPRMSSPRSGPEGTVPVYAAEAWYGANSLLRTGTFLF
ncbi:MAG: hypothetical protein ACYCZV_12485, partial [Acidimicrobiales bacterium]